MIAFFVISFWTTILIVSVQLVGGSFATKYVFFLRWKKLLQKVMGLEITFEGQIPEVPAIITPNHRSYVDIIVVASKIPMVFVSKAEVRKWPIVGWGAHSINTVWIDRKSRESRDNTREELKKRLAQNESAIVFTEGTTNRGPECLPFKSGMFKLIAEGNIPVIPVAIEYQDQDMAWVGSDTFLGHFIRHFGKRKHKLKVRYGNPIQNADANVLRTEAQDWVNANLLEMRKEWDASTL